MATTIRLIEGFNGYSTVADVAENGLWFDAVGSLNVGAGRHIGAAFGIATNADDRIGTHLDEANGLYFRIGFAIKVTNFPTSTSYCMVHSNANSPSSWDVNNYLNCCFGIGPNGTLRLYRAGGGIQWDSPGNVLVLDQWHYVEVGMAIANSPNGAIDLYVDGQLITSQTGIDTLDAAGSYLAFTTTNGNLDFLIDDIYIAQDDTAIPAPLGTVRVQPLFPNGDTAQADFTGTYADVDDPIGGGDDDVSYVSSDTLNAESRFDVESLPAGAWTVHGVKVQVEHRKDAAGDRSVATTMTSGVTTAQGAERPLSETVYSTQADVYDTNPATGTQWTQAEVDNMQIGFKITI